MRIVRVNFNSEQKAMLGHCKMILEQDPRKIATEQECALFSYYSIDRRNSYDISLYAEWGGTLISSFTLYSSGREYTKQEDGIDNN
jgi:hypothetical protein